MLLALIWKDRNSRMIMKKKKKKKRQTISYLRDSYRPSPVPISTSAAGIAIREYATHAFTIRTRATFHIMTGVLSIAGWGQKVHWAAAKGFGPNKLATAGVAATTSGKYLLNGVHNDKGCVTLQVPPWASCPLPACCPHCQSRVLGQLSAAVHSVPLQQGAP